jgi:hypothetical protein
MNYWCADFYIIVPKSKLHFIITELHTLLWQDSLSGIHFRQAILTIAILVHTDNI